LTLIADTESGAVCTHVLTQASQNQQPHNKRTLIDLT
jgi:hypothetical protein